MECIVSKVDYSAYFHGPKIFLAHVSELRHQNYCCELQLSYPNQFARKFVNLKVQKRPLGGRS